MKSNEAFWCIHVYLFQLENNTCMYKKQFPTEQLLLEITPKNI